LAGSDQVAGAHLAIAIGIEKTQRVRIELEPFHRTGEGDPKLLIELVEMEKVIAAIKPDLVEATGAEKTPAMGGYRHTHVSRKRPPCGGLGE
jgi:hypothetical protein